MRDYLFLKNVKSNAVKYVFCFSILHIIMKHTGLSRRITKPNQTNLRHFSYQSSDRLPRRNAKSILSLFKRSPLVCSFVSCYFIPAFSCPASWSVNFTSVIFTSCIFSAPVQSLEVAAKRQNYVCKSEKERNYKRPELTPKTKSCTHCRDEKESHLVHTTHRTLFTIKYGSS